MITIIKYILFEDDDPPTKKANDLLKFNVRRKHTSWDTAAFLYYTVRVREDWYKFDVMRWV